MRHDARVILRAVGLMLHVPGVMAILSMPVAWCAGEPDAFVALLATALASAVLGQTLVWSCRHGGELRQHHALKVAALSWLIVPLIGAMPFAGLALAGVAGAETFARPSNALFEAFSGFTGTGLTVVGRPSLLPATLQWWRSFSEWVGGIGVIMVMLSILRPSVGMRYMYASEAREERIRPTVRGTARTIWWIFLGYTIVAILAFRACGVDWWRAVNHGMTGISTGGFTITDGGFADHGIAPRLVALVVMALGAVSFATHRQVLSGRFGSLWRDGQHRYLLLLLAGGGVVSVLEGRLDVVPTPWSDAVFQWVSALATAGFQSTDLGGWSEAHKLVLVFAMLIGGAAGSTAGGLKQARLFMLVRGLHWRLRSALLRPREIQRYELDGRGVSEDEARSRVEAAAVFAFAWVAVLCCTVLVLLHAAPGAPTLGDVLFEAASAQSNVGLSVGITDAGLPWPAKLTLIASMYVGRLEIMPLLLLVFDAARRIGRGRP